MARLSLFGREVAFPSPLFIDILNLWRLIELMKEAYRLELNELAKTLVTQERFGKVALQPTVELKLVESEPFRTT